MSPGEVPPMWMPLRLILEIPQCDTDVNDDQEKMFDARGYKTFLRDAWPIPGEGLPSKKEAERQRLFRKRNLWKVPCLFTKFMELPFELRWKIWKMSDAMSARTIGFVAHRFGHVQPLVRVPIILHVYQESRREALKEYQLCFASICRNPLHINFEIDRAILLHSADIQSLCPWQMFSWLRRRGRGMGSRPQDILQWDTGLACQLLVSLPSRATPEHRIQKTKVSCHAVFGIREFGRRST